MGAGATHAVIFDIDGVLLHLTPDEEKLFFDAFRTVHAVAEHHLNPDWNSYRVRNDLAIAGELLERHFGRPATEEEVEHVLAHYAGTIAAGLLDGSLQARAVDGARALLEHLRDRGHFALGLATANIRDAATRRLRNADLWGYYDVMEFAEAGGPKINILRQAIGQLAEIGGIAHERIVFLGDQLGDLAAARENQVHFIGTSPSAEQCEMLRAHGAQHIATGHHETAAMITRLLELDHD
jgi:phosphoglycolate phosphatase-like HAD superfamily hydrolase